MIHRRLLATAFTSSLLLSLAGCGPTATRAGDPIPRDSAESAWPIENRRYFGTLEELKRTWQVHASSFKIQEGQLSGTRYTLVVDSPYSGVNAVDVYCYVNYSDRSWRLYAVCFVPPSRTTDPKSFEIDAAAKDGFLELRHNGAVVMTVDVRSGKL